jgi:hypothetical protein
MLLQQLIKIQESSQPSKVVEAYEESSDFDAEFDKAEKHLKDALAIVTSADWKKHMRDTDKNFSTNGVSRNNDIVKAIQSSIGELGDLLTHFEEEAS